MHGLVTDQDLEEAEAAFPGISEFLQRLTEKPRTFLDLVARFEHWCEPSLSAIAVASAHDRTAKNGATLGS